MNDYNIDIARKVVKKANEMRLKEGKEWKQKK